jgi:hypothetical protein
MNTITSRYLTSLLTGCLVLAHAGAVQAQFAGTGTTTISVAVAPEAALQINTSTSTLSATGTTFNANYTGSTSLSYKVRTTKVGGSGTITLKITTDFSPAGRPSVRTPPTAGDILAYTCTLTAPGTACSGSQTSSTSVGTPVGTFGADAKSASSGNGGSVAWTLTNDPQYSTGTYTATVTFTISAT